MTMSTGFIGRLLEVEERHYMIGIFYMVLGYSPPPRGGGSLFEHISVCNDHVMSTDFIGRSLEVGERH